MNQRTRELIEQERQRADRRMFRRAEVAKTAVRRDSRQIDRRLPSQQPSNVQNYLIPACPSSDGFIDY